MSDVTINLCYGYPGSGKSTYAAFLARKFLKKGITVYSNVAIKGCKILNPRLDLGIYDTSDSVILIDEASIEFNNRDFKSFPKTCISFFKLHRHYHCQIYVFSQSFDDTDITIRRLCHNIFWIRNTWIKYFISVTPISKFSDVINGELIDSYEIHNFPFLAKKYIFTPPAWQLFDTHEADQLMVKDWRVFGQSSAESISADTVTGDVSEVSSPVEPIS